MNYLFTNDKPIYLQIMEAFKASIVSGELKPGGRLDSVRDLAIEAKVNPNTMQKALSELERIGLVRTERTSGRFITEDGGLINSMKKEIAESEITAFLKKMEALGINKEAVIDLIKNNNEIEEA
ncbi:MAG: GntR family transcriptional regulator [Treponema sp.]|jgi:DNA-binding transcriptional regulator YhcF (GntR family)|nr:GntR family transcriptional regulator [Treponema sp.]